jgi:hypothetical protein
VKSARCATRPEFNVLEEFKMASSTASFVGILCVLLGCFLAALGYVLQKRGQLLTVSGGSLWRSPSWLGGLLCMGIASGLVVASAAFVDQSKSAPLGAATLVFNIFLAALILKEKFLVIHALSALLVIAGTLLAVLAAPASGKVFTLADMLALFDSAAVAYSVIVGVLLLASVTYLERATWRGKGVPARLYFRFAALAACVGGAANGFVTLSTKVISSAVVTGDWDAFTYPVMYAYMLLGAAALVAQVRYLNTALSFASALQVVPIFQAAIIISGSLVGIIYFHDLRSIPSSLGLFGAGAAVLSSGVLVLALQRAAPVSSSSSKDCLPEVAAAHSSSDAPAITDKSSTLATGDHHAEEAAISESPKAQLLRPAPTPSSLSDARAVSAAARAHGSASNSAVCDGGGLAVAASIPWWEEEALIAVRRLGFALVMGVRVMVATTDR